MDADTLVPPRAMQDERARAGRLLQAHAAELRCLGVERLSLFGSIARGDASAASDIDVLISVSPQRKFSLFDLGEVRVRICEWLGRESDVLIEEDLQPAFRARISRDIVRIF